MIIKLTSARFSFNFSLKSTNYVSFNMDTDAASPSVKTGAIKKVSSNTASTSSSSGSYLKVSKKPSSLSSPSISYQHTRSSTLRMKHVTGRAPEVEVKQSDDVKAVKKTIVKKKTSKKPKSDKIVMTLKSADDVKNLIVHVASKIEVKQDSASASAAHPKVITCPICLSDPPIEPTTTKCGHIFCHECLHKAFENHKMNCAMCNKKIEIKDLRRVYI
ncbi:E3 ubiquitin-protein ligase RNF4-like [Culicoides brevitarsis]|uniref:E3 ubiquitin-protein ligase RNF4-like n=1 Tax=Culicoides brevitarsis TaxID=469753 RepID=UPI00307BCCE2